MFEKEWLIQLGVRPAQMTRRDPPSIPLDANSSRLFHSIYSVTLAEQCLPPRLSPSLVEHLEMEREYSSQSDLQVCWSDDLSLTLTFLVSLAHHGCYSQTDLLQRYFQWWMNGLMCPAGLCFTPQRQVKKSIDLFGESQSASALGLELDWEEKTSELVFSPSAFLRLSPVAYFYRAHSPEERRSIVEDCSRRMFGRATPSDGLCQYVELLVKALNGHEKESLLQAFPEDLSRLREILRHDGNDIAKGIEEASKELREREEECAGLNPLDSNVSILLTLYLQVTGALYNQHPPGEIYAQSTLDGLIHWILFESERHLHSGERVSPERTDECLRTCPKDS